MPTWGTQNPTESFNNCVWERIPKTTFVGLQTLQIGVMDAVIYFNDGSISRTEVLRNLNIEPGFYTGKALALIDRERIYEAENVLKNSTKAAQTAKKI